MIISISTALWLLILLVIAVITEFHMISKGVPASVITEWLWAHVAWIRKVKW